MRSIRSSDCSNAQDIKDVVYRRFLIIAAALFCLYDPLTAQQPPTKTLHFWTPRNPREDLRSNEDAAFFRYLVSNAVPQIHRVSQEDQADGLDGIIRRTFLVARSNSPRAYQVYLDDIIRRNPDKVPRLTRLIPGQDTLILPSGPQYAGKEDPSMPTEVYERKVNRALAMGRVDLPAEEMEARLLRSAGPYTLSAARIGSDPDAREEALAEIRERKIVPARVDFDRFPGEGSSHFSIIELGVSPAEVPAEYRENIIDNIMTASAAPAVDCRGVCRSCTDILAIPPPSNSREFRSRVIIADTGYSLNQALDAKAKVLSATDPDFGDGDPQNHGSFLYSEIIRPNGPLDPGSVFIAKVARPPQKDEIEIGLPVPKIVWDLKVLGLTIQKIATMPGKKATWVLNISAAGKAETIGMPDFMQFDRRMLFVAAAGNDGSPDLPLSILFARQRTPHSNLLIVGALDTARPPNRASYSNYHEEQVDIFAQGSCTCGFGIQLSGTSQAAPIVSTAAAIIADANPAWDAAQIKWRLISTSDLLDSSGLPSTASVGGVLNLKRALSTGIAVKTKDGVEWEAKRLVAIPGEAKAWQPLFPAGEQVLRLHRTECDGSTKPGFVCFRKFVFKARTKSPIAIPADSILTIEATDGSTRKVRADTLVDLFLPVDRLPT